MRKLVILESPYAGETPEIVDRNLAYARKALRDSLLRDEAPIASHLLYTQVLDDKDIVARRKGIDAGLAWLDVAEGMVVYADHGISPGMAYGMDAAHEARIPVEIRYMHVGALSDDIGAGVTEQFAAAIGFKEIKDRFKKNIDECMEEISALSVENDRLVEENETLNKANTALRSQDTRLQAKIKQLEDALRASESDLAAEVRAAEVRAYWSAWRVGEG